MGLFVLFCSFETRSPYVAHAGLEPATLLSQSCLSLPNARNADLHSFLFLLLFFLLLFPPPPSCSFCIFLFSLPFSSSPSLLSGMCGILYQKGPPQSPTLEGKGVGLQLWRQEAQVLPERL